MKTKRDTTGTEQMSDAQLSKQLGYYQKRSVIGIWVGLIGVIGGTVSYFAVDDAATRAILMLFFGGVCCALFLGGGAQKRIKALMQSQLGDFFRTELETAFGPEDQTCEMPIDEAVVKRMHLRENQWEECQVENFHRGRYRGVRFSAANVRLDHVYERAIPHEGLETCREMVFKGLALRCETRISAPSFRADMPQFTEALKELQRGLNGTVWGVCWEKNIFSLALETEYEFAAVDRHVDLRNLDAVRNSYRESLRKMEDILKLLLKNEALFAGMTEKEGNP